MRRCVQTFDWDRMERHMKHRSRTVRFRLRHPDCHRVSVTSIPATEAEGEKCITCYWFVCRKSEEGRSELISMADSSISASREEP
ncbi:hypothetical protein MHYP_G00240710 [Metynnis hypsauchen]